MQKLIQYTEHHRSLCNSRACTGPHGKTSLEGEPTGPGFMMRKDLEKKVDPASVKEHMCY